MKQDEFESLSIFEQATITPAYQQGFLAGAASRNAEVQRLQSALADAEALELGTAERCDQLRAHINDLRDAFQTFIDEHEECAILTRSNRQKLDGTRIEM